MSGGESKGCGRRMEVEEDCRGPYLAAWGGGGWVSLPLELHSLTGLDDCLKMPRLM
jgi:hypothetical protein